MRLNSNFQKETPQYKSLKTIKKWIKQPLFTLVASII
jgi:hypothetical protein